jgi:hypothetical protein
MLSVEETHQPERKDTNHDTLNGGSSSLPLKKRKNEQDATESSDPIPEQTSSGHENQDAHNDNDPSQNEDSGPPSKSKSPSSMSKSRQLRLTQNRKAARESRRRKKMMIEELQRSTIFFSTANQALKQQNNDLSRRLVEAHAELAKLGEPVAPLDSKLVKLLKTLEHNQAFSPEGESASTSKAQQVEVTAGSAPLAGPPSVASHLTSSVPVATCSHDLPTMQTGSTMQAMANFQQAATAAMQAAAHGMQALGGLPDTTATASHAAQLSHSTGLSDGQTQKPSPATIVYL